MKTQFSALNRRPAYAQVFDVIENEILSGSLAPGAALPTEQELCGQFNVQRSTVREGIRLLEQSGLVTRGNGRRLLVSRPEVADSAEKNRKDLERQGARFIDIWQAASVLQPALARMAASRGDAAAIAELEENTRRLEAATSPAQLVSNDNNFFHIVAKASGNRVLGITAISLDMLTKQSLMLVIDRLPNALQRIVQAQKEILTAIKSGNGDKAEEWMSRHIDDLYRGYELAGVDLETEVALFQRSGAVSDALA